MQQKTYTIDFMTKKRVRNNGYVKCYYIENNHEAIISRQQYYMVQEELKRRNNKMSSSTRYSSQYPLSGLIVCEECGSKYTRATWYEDGDKKKVPIWRCGERMKTGIIKCKSSPSLKGDKLYCCMLNQIQIIMDSEIDTATSPILQTKASIANYIGENKIHNFTMTKAMWARKSIFQNDSRNKGRV